MISATRPALIYAMKHFDSVDSIVEVGVFWGNNAVSLYDNLRPRMMYLVDQYKPYAEHNFPESKFKNDQRRAVLKMLGFGYPHTFFFLPSIEAAKVIPNELDLVYIDAAHDKENVMADIRSWWPKVRLGGMLCGHDYDHPDWPSVKEAVKELLPTASGHGCDWWIVKETGDELCQED